MNKDQLLLAAKIGAPVIVAAAIAAVALTNNKVRTAVKARFAREDAPLFAPETATPITTTEQ